MQTSFYARLVTKAGIVLVPQSDVRTLESVLELHREEHDDTSVGSLEFEDALWPVYCVDEAFHPVSEIPSDQRICVLLRCDQEYFGLMCTDITTVNRAHIQSRPVPMAMRQYSSVLEALALYDGRLSLVSATTLLAKALAISEALVVRLPAGEQAADKILAKMDRVTQQYTAFTP